MFNKLKFAQIIKEIKETYSSQEDFAKKSGIGRTYISQYMNMKLDVPPKPKILEKLANSSNGITSYYELMSICDYIRTPDLFSNEINPSLVESFKDTLREYGISNIDINSIENISKSNDPNIDKKIANILSRYDKSIIENVFYTLQVNRQNLSNEIEIFRPIKQLLNIYDNRKSIQEINKKADKSALVFVYGTIPAGIPMECIEDIIDTEEISVNMLKGNKQYFGLKVKGDSMFPEYLDGDTLILEKVEDVESGQDAVIMVNGDDGTFKRVFKNESGIILQPLNSNYAPLVFSNEDIISKPVKIIGKVVELRRKK